MRVWLSLSDLGHVGEGRTVSVSGLVSTDSTPLCKAKRQYLLTCEVSRYCLLALHGRVDSLCFYQRLHNPA